MLNPSCVPSGASCMTVEYHSVLNSPEPPMGVLHGVRPSIVLLSTAGTLEAPRASCKGVAVLAEKPSEWQPLFCSLLFLPARVNHWHPDDVVKLSERESTL